MFNNLIYFIKNNRKIIQKASKKNYSTLLIDRGSFTQLYSLIYSSVLNKKYKHNIITLINDPNNKLIKSFYKVLDIIKLFRALLI